MMDLNFKLKQSTTRNKKHELFIKKKGGVKASFSSYFMIFGERERKNRKNWAK